MGGSMASRERSPLGQRYILQNPRHPQLGICHNRQTRGWEEEGTCPAESGGHADKAACQDQGRTQSERPTVGPILRAPMGQEDDEPATGPREALPGLAEAGSPVSDLSGTDRNRYPLGHPLHCEKNRRWVDCSGQQFNSTIAVVMESKSTPEISCESGCRKMSWQRLDLYAGKLARTVLR
ncbi:hypothetical protein SAMN05444172_9015 [Burkholderia sp. GAS332]|nr:hypothetical protein SAMN05444172_9015 [Burkholderia sp. GAS332]